MSKRKDNDGASSSQGQIVQIDEAQIKGHLDEMVRGTVEEMLNRMLDAEAERLVGAGRYEREAPIGRTPVPGTTREALT